MILTNVQFETTDLKVVEEKMAAYQALFDTEPALFICGRWLDKCGEHIFFSRQQEIPLENIGRKYVMASVDEGPLEKIKPVDGAKFEISWKQIGVGR